MIEQSGLSARKVSTEIGRHPNYLGATLAKGSDVGIANVARIAEKTGYEVILKGHDEEIKIDPSQD